MALHVTQEMIDFLKNSDTHDEFDDFDEDDIDWDNQPIYAHQGASCPECNRNFNIVHSECGEYVDLCTCQGSIDKTYHCFGCDVSFTNEDDGSVTSYKNNQVSLFDDDGWDIGYDYESWKGKNDKYVKGLTPTKTTTTTKPLVKKCSHKHDEMEIAEGYFVHCSSVNYTIDVDPDFGLYADYSWRPTWRNEFINWPDYGQPKDKDNALVQIADAYDRILNGEMVEIGCIGGHGRTGTILACLYMLGQEGSKTPKECFNFVKQNYCVHAIESDIQEWFIEYASHVWYGTELSEEPAPKANKYVGTGKNTMGCNMTDHFSMMIRGWTTCADKGSDCHYWKGDLEKFKAGQYKETIEKANALDNLMKYDYMYGGLFLMTDPQDSPCKPIDHYAMVLNGHEKCIRLGDLCTWWEKDFTEYVKKSTINDIGLAEWQMEADRVKFYLELYPKAEEMNDE